jgi:hypothetical protein
LQILGLAVLLVGARQAVDLTSAAAYVYPDFDFGQFWFVLLLFFSSIVFVAILAVVRLYRKRFVEAVALLAILCAPFMRSTSTIGNSESTSWNISRQYRPIAIHHPNIAFSTGEIKIPMRWAAASFSKPLFMTSPTKSRDPHQNGLSAD